MQSEELKPCPFCGGPASIEQYGDRSQSTIYNCDNCSCSLETGEEFNHGAQWNCRAEAVLSAAGPVSSRNDEAGYVEFLNQDVPYVVRDIQGAVAILMDLETRNVIGYRVYDPDSVFAPPAPSVAVKALKPFATDADIYDGQDIDDGEKSFNDNITVGDLRRARAAYDALSAQVQDVAAGVMASIAEERKRQIAKGYNVSHDDAHDTYEIIDASWGAAARINMARSFRDQHNISGYKAALVQAAAQIVAEIERLDRAAAPAKQEG
ncbi:hypothetical protein J2S28_001593 [Rhizobium sp. SLBN-94]|nr:hypothetical protein [Rhizobium sp. SLBN-94]